ncbi:CapA family protein [Streptomyces sp. NPDC049577]|uniref:CapA family protein n=1 Tax=Streptomyces sp. NPDC049577 TaxID=3155153 RepID=UPI003430982E
MRKRRRRTAVAVVGVLAALTAGCTPPGVERQRARSGSAKAARTAPGGFTLVATGDVIPHDAVIRQAHQDGARSGTAYDFRPMLAGVRGVVAGADVAICHMETVYGEANGPFSGYPLFVSPPQIAQALKETGYDSCSTASNHTLDAGPAGVRRTLDAMDAAGLRHAGSARTAAEGAGVTLLPAGRAKLAHLSYTYATNGIPVPHDQPWAVNLMDRDRILADARAARRAGADVVVVSLHWGTEWQQEPDAQQLTLARELTAAATGGRPDVDLILGTHNHVPQAYEKVNGTWVVYGMGDQLAGEMFNPAGAPDARGNRSSIARFTFAPPPRAGQRWPVVKAEFVPQLTDLKPPLRVVDLNRAVADQPERSDLADARERIRAAVLSRGAGKDGLVLAD